jgi:uncharacterized protein YodC (DUF2158 family)
MVGGKFRPGDMVIMAEGGNKMRVTEVGGGSVTCIWATDTLFTGTFLEAELMSVEDYDRCATQQTERQDKINQLL